MDCFKCGNKLSGVEEIEIMEAEADLSKLFMRPKKLPKEFKCCDEGKKLLTGERVEN